MVYDQSFWDNKWPKAPIIYKGRMVRKGSKALAIDVKDFITDRDDMVANIITRYGLKKSTMNETAWNIQKWVVKFLTYKYDEESSDCPEFWMFPFESLQTQIGDCEDGAILMTTLCIAAGIPPWRVKVAAGNVQDSPTAPQGGHAYCIYLADRPETERKLDWVILDWCYYEDTPLPVEKKPLARDGGYNKCYKDTWFTFNNLFTWNQTALSIDAGRISANRNVTLDETVQEEEKFVEEIMESIAAKVGQWQQ